MKSLTSKFVIFYGLGVLIGAISSELSFYKMLTVCVIGGLVASILISKWSKEES
jgi:hypothetical protein